MGLEVIRREWSRYRRDVTYFLKYKGRYYAEKGLPDTHPSDMHTVKEWMKRVEENK